MTKKLVPARILGSPRGCKNKCSEKLGGAEIKFFDEFWNLGLWDLQNSYLFGCVNIVQKNRSYRHKQTKNEPSRNYNANYFINVNSQSIKGCKNEFLNVHGLQQLKGRLNNIVSKKI